MRCKQAQLLAQTPQLLPPNNITAGLVQELHVPGAASLQSRTIKPRPGSWVSRRFMTPLLFRRLDSRFRLLGSSPTPTKGCHEGNSEKEF